MQTGYIETTSGVVPPPILRAENVRKTYRRNGISTEVLKGVDFSVNHGEFVSIVGASGSGKSTLLHLMGTLDSPDAGAIWLGDRRIDNLPGRERDKLRNGRFGFIFQFYHLLPELTAVENVLAPELVASSVWQWPFRKKAATRRAEELLERVGLGHRKHHRPREMSGGEMQRTAIARAIMTRPGILFADEPTGNLDEAAGAEIMALLRELNRADGLTVLMVTHNMEMANTTDRIVRLASGRIDPTRQPVQPVHSLSRPPESGRMEYAYRGVG
jgi:lipoprotein-releasing system ATP-binding protein